MNEKLNWKDSLKRCQSEGGSLASIPDKETDEFLSSTFTSPTYWVGGTKVGNSWQWEDGTPFTFTNWNPDYKEPTGEDCIRHNLWGTKKWSDHWCTSLTTFVCQKKSPSMNFSVLPPTLKFLISVFSCDSNLRNSSVSP